MHNTRRESPSPTVAGAASTSELLTTLRLRFMVPILIGIIIMLLASVLGVSYYHTDKRSHSIVSNQLENTRAMVQKLLLARIKTDTGALRSILEALQTNPVLLDLFRSGDRLALLNYSQALYSTFYLNFNITHFYFERADRTNFLRVHAPFRHGDTIDRITTLRAEASGEIASGIEVGVLGTVTLRVVLPWVDPENGELIGYLELGKEINSIAAELNQATGIGAFLVLHKSSLDGEQWQLGMAALGRYNTWDRYTHIVMPNKHSSGTYENYFKQYSENTKTRMFNLAGRSMQPVIIDIYDIENRDVADLVIIEDITFPIKTAEKALITAIVVIFLIGIPLLLFFSLQAKKVAHQLEDNERNLHQLAEIDALTSLATRRVFDESLAREIQRSIRYKRPIALMMIDIDHFKNVNDTYGHLAGDCVLKELGKLLLSNVRDLDICCRYGGEELAVILPETEIETAYELAERVRIVIETTLFNLGNEKKKHITVSIGVAAYPHSCDKGHGITECADKALYKAKQTGRNRVCGLSDLPE